MWDGPFPIADGERSLVSAAGEHQQQRHRVVGDVIEAIVGNVGDQHIPLSGRVDVDVVEADSVAGHDPHSGISGGIDNWLGHLRVTDQHRVSV